MPEFFTSIADLLEGSFLQSAALWTLRTVPGFPPIIQTVHILGIAVLMGTIVMLNLRVLGLAVRSQELTEITERVMPWVWWALASNLVSGAFFLFARPYRYFNNPVFGWKVSFLIPAVVLTLVFYWMQKRQTGYWEQDTKHLWSARAIALVSLVCWIMVAMAGRWIAYVEYLYYPA
jgi:hypothetical protein|tara:strand:+ start:297 stop:824 length:528 start_codon:yes stop_codon:yes gene_type:complete